MDFEGTLYEADNFNDINSISYCSDILKKIEEKFSEYLNFFDKEWESLEIRNQWVYNNLFRLILYLILIIFKTS